MNLRSLALLTLAIAVPAAGFAQVKNFKVVGERLAFRNVATVESETEFETFVGRTSNVSGTIKFDPKTKTGSGSLSVDVKSIDTGIPTRNDHLQGEGWLNAAKHPNITFVTTNVRHLGSDNYRVTGKFTMNGVTKTITTTAKVRYRAASEQTKAAGFTGDVVNIQTKFPVKLSDYGIKISGPATGKVNNTVTISLSAYATAS